MNRVHVHQSLSAFALAAGACSSSLAQTFNNPTFYVWGEYPAVGDYSNFSHPFMMRSMHMGLQDNQMTAHGWITPMSDPEGAADALAYKIVNELASGRLIASKICVILQNFGADSERCDAGWDAATDAPIPDPDQGSPRVNGVLTSSLRFYHPDPFPAGDRIPDMYEWSQQPNIPDQRFPIPRNSDDPIQSADYRGARSYRHPFLRNADTGTNPDGSAMAPLREWMRVFVNRLHAVYLTPTLAGLPANAVIPSPATYKWYFDTEPYYPHGDAAFPFIIRFLANPAHLVPGTSTAWWDWPLGGAFGTQTLRQSWEANRDYAGGEASADLLSDTIGLHRTQNPDHPNNIAACRWFQELLRKQHDFVMKNCAYDVLNAKWGTPTTPVACGNYEDMSVDGEDDRFGWSQDRAWMGTIAASNTDTPAAWAIREVWPRMIIDKGRGGPMLYLKDDDVSWRYITQKLTASGSVSSPSMYRLGLFEFYGRDAALTPGGQVQNEYQWLEGGPKQGHRRWNMYRPTNPWTSQQYEETPWQATMRLHRHTAESIINSTGVGGGSDKLVPWVQMSAVNDSLDNGAEARKDIDFVTRAELRRMLMMLRSKNITEGVFWTRWYNRNNEPLWAQTLDIAWRQTQAVVREVYEPRIDTYRKIFGTWTQSPHTVVPSRLEFTLRQGAGEGTDQTVDINSNAPMGSLPGMPPPPPSTKCEFEVDFVWPANYTLFDDQVNSQFSILSNIETATSIQGVKLRVYIRDFAYEAWQQLASDEYQDNEAVVETPASSDGLRRTRQSFIGWRANTSEQENYRATINSKVISRLKVQMVYDAEPVLGFTSKTDLVQLAFYPEINIISQSTSTMLAGPSFSVADLNMDGVVNEWDAVQFVDEYELAQPAANLNDDNAVDEADVDVFVEALLNS